MLIEDISCADNFVSSASMWVSLANVDGKYRTRCHDVDMKQLRLGEDYWNWKGKRNCIYRLYCIIFKLERRCSLLLYVLDLLLKMQLLLIQESLSLCFLLLCIHKLLLPRIDVEVIVWEHAI